MPSVIAAASAIFSGVRMPSNCLHTSAATGFRQKAWWLLFVVHQGLGTDLLSQKSFGSVGQGGGRAER